jgi:hypothetical protein
MINATQHWCTEYNDPYEISANRSVQHFARMWYDLLVDSPDFLNLIQGESDPYVWTTGQGCGYNLDGSRMFRSYTRFRTHQCLMQLFQRSRSTADNVATKDKEV